jgi:hypothetical protein
MGMRKITKSRSLKIVSIETVKSTVGFLAIPAKGAEVFFGESIGQIVLPVLDFDCCA